jgi:hypothetical protein
MAQGLPDRDSAPRFKQWIARTIFLPRMFKLGDFPGKSELKSPAFLVPSPEPAPQTELLPRFETAARGLEQDLESARAAGRTKAEHPFFGTLDLADLLHFVVIHTRHHLPQIVTTSPTSS